MKEVGQLYGKIPYIVRKVAEGHSGVDDVEAYLLEASQKSLIDESEIQEVYIDNKNSPQNIIVTLHNGVIPEESNVSVPMNGVEDEEGYPVLMHVIYSPSDKVEVNIVKSTCQELGLTYKQLGEAIGYGEGTLKVCTSNNKVSKSMEKAISLYLETIKLKKELQKFEQFKSLIRDIK